MGVPNWLYTVPFLTQALPFNLGVEFCFAYGYCTTWGGCIPCCVWPLTSTTQTPPKLAHELEDTGRIAGNCGVEAVGDYMAHQWWVASVHGVVDWCILVLYSHPGPRTFSVVGAPWPHLLYVYYFICYTSVVVVDMSGISQTTRGKSSIMRVKLMTGSCPDLSSKTNKLSPVGSPFIGHNLSVALMWFPGAVVCSWTPAQVGPCYWTCCKSQCIS